jgi:hypothetical protein
MDETKIEIQELPKTSTPLPKSYSAIKKYRSTEKGREKYNEGMRRYYDVKKNDEEWLNNHRERSRIANRKYRAKLKGIEMDETPRPRGRPRKVLIS